MRYWGYFAAKLAVCGASMYGLLMFLNARWPVEQIVVDHKVVGHFPLFGDLAFTLVLGLWFLMCSGLLALCIIDQRRRCPVCLRRLRMPVETGSWDHMLLLGRPRIESICPYGHGTLKEAEIQISGLETPEWSPNAEMWDELCASSKPSDEQP